MSSTNTRDTQSPSPKGHPSSHPGQKKLSKKQSPWHNDAGRAKKEEEEEEEEERCAREHVGACTDESTVAPSANMHKVKGGLWYGG